MLLKFVALVVTAQTVKKQLSKKLQTAIKTSEETKTRRNENKKKLK